MTHNTTANDTHYGPLTLTAIRQLIAPQTWVAAIAPVLVGTALSIGLGDYTPLSFLATPRAPLVAALMLITACAAQSATNTLNDYSDYKTGSDTLENCVDETEAAILYHALNPRDVRRTALACLGLALVTGLALAALSGWVVLALGLVGLAAVLTYSAGPKPISYLPLGELVSGTVMGIIITAATYLALTGHFSLTAALATLPPFITIAAIMQTNNTADIARDITAGRRTLPIYLGERRSASVIAAGNIVALALAFALCLTHWRFGSPLMVAAAFFSYFNIRTLATGPYDDPANRSRLMQAIVRQTAIINALFALSILIGAHFNA